MKAAVNWVFATQLIHGVAFPKEAVTCLTDFAVRFPLHAQASVYMQWASK